MHNAEKTLQIRSGKRDELFVWFGAQPEEIRLEIVRIKIDTYRRWATREGRTKEMSAEQLDYAALLSSIMDVWRGLRSGKKIEDFELRVKAAKAKKKARLAPKADLLEREFLPLISRLLSDGLSWRQISEYIQKHHHKKFAHAYLHKIYQQWQPRSAESSGAGTPVS
ncbi:hypothetical protein KP005_04665 [Geomonas nitrogeniifigens]|uniref:Uncharacterized protein n=1 Tax=Geomonas diazotrophica TaxID=2843197 RepID=A0ABX8JKT3_9BACT|nr:hypothetical protein [Geomonas nitrogeniifigens]QWV98586.1 hypothetical protein KP005_04665 [Geomonas nitrogeniifigens]